MSWRVLSVAVAAAIVVFPLDASAAGGPPTWPVGDRVALGYGEFYTSAQGRCLHHGVDIPAEAGSAVRSCTDGTVIFAGRVPAGTGTSCFAVTVHMADGLRVSYLPLEHLDVSAGVELTAGEAIGRLAGSGDPSDAATHLHMGVRDATGYVDPSRLLPERSPSVASDPVVPPDGAAGLAASVGRSTARHSVAHETAPVTGSAPAAVRVPTVSMPLRPVRPFADLPGLSVLPTVRHAPQVRFRRVRADAAASRARLVPMSCLMAVMAGVAVACASAAERLVEARPARLQTHRSM